MSLSLIDNYLTENMDDIDLYSDFDYNDYTGNKGIKNYYISDNYVFKDEVASIISKDSFSSVDNTPFKKEKLVNEKLRKRNSTEMYKKKKEHSNGYDNKFISYKYEEEPVTNKSLVISKESDRLYDFYNDRKSAIHYKRYGQFLSLASDADPEDKYIIDIFDLYKKVKNTKNKQKQKLPFLKRLGSFFRRTL